jgi:hypothetical protein
VKSQVLFVVAVLLASGSALSTMSPCWIDCEDSYKSCVSSRKTSERACLVQLEKCRKGCEKKEGTAPAG